MEFETLADAIADLQSRPLPERMRDWLWLDSRRISKVRRARGMTLDQLARAAAIGPGTIASYEHHSHAVPPETLRRLADALDAPIDSLVLKGTGRKQS